MLSKLIGIIVIIMYFQSSIALQVKNKDNGNEWPETCDDKKHLCGIKLVYLVNEVCGPKFSNCTGYITIPQSPFYQDKMSRIPRATVKSCCDIGCTPRFVKQFVCTDNSTEIMQSSVEEKEGQFFRVVVSEEDVHEVVKYIVWNYYLKYLPHYWLYNFLNVENDEPYYLWTLF